MALIAVPPDSDLNRASEIYGFTWSLEIISLFFVVSRMYSRIKLTRNVWWDDWFVCIAFVGLCSDSATHILTDLDFGLHHLSIMDRLCWPGLRKAFILHSSKTDPRHYQTQYDITSHVHVQYLDREDICRTLDRTNCRTQQMEEMGASVDICQRFHHGCDHLDTVLRTMQSRASCLGQGLG